MSQPQRDHLQEAHKVFRRIQLKFGPSMSSTLTLFIRVRCEEALAKDPTGLQVLHFANDLEELLTPMKG